MSLNEKIKAAIDDFVAHKHPPSRIRHHLGVGLGPQARFPQHVVDADFYEQAKNVIMDTQISHRIPLSSEEYEEAVKYACKELGF